MSAVLKKVTRALSTTGAEDRIIAEALAILERRHAPGEALANPADVRAYLRLRLAERHFAYQAEDFLDEYDQYLGCDAEEEATLMETFIIAHTSDTPGGMLAAV